VRLRHDTVLSADVYRTDLYGQLFQSSNLDGTCSTNPVCSANDSPNDPLPFYVDEYLNLTHSRFEGITLNIHRDVPHGIYWNAGLGLTRGYIISVPAGFYNAAGQTCNYATGVGCANTYAIANQNFTYIPGNVAYANGSADLGYRWAAKKSLDVQANYLGNNNAYFQPAFLEFDAHASYPLAKNFALFATLTNITGIHDQNYQVSNGYNPIVAAPSIAGAEVPLNSAPYGPRTLTVTANIQL
jgi:hypothetical protein